MAICDWPEDERPREKLLHRGPEALSDAELLAIFLRTGCRGLTAVDLARQMLGQFGGLAGLLRADRASFCGIKGLGAAKFAQLHAVLELARRHLGESLVREQVFGNPAQVKDYLRLLLATRDREVFVVLYLDSHHRLIACEELFQGTIDGASVFPREVVKRSLRHNAAAAIVAHNHPSGVAEPSDADRDITGRLKAALALVDVRLLDHLVVGSGSAVSLAERGML